MAVIHPDTPAVDLGSNTFGSQTDADVMNDLDVVSDQTVKNDDDKSTSTDNNGVSQIFDAYVNINVAWVYFGESEGGVHTVEVTDNGGDTWTEVLSTDLGQYTVQQAEWIRYKFDNVTANGIRISTSDSDNRINEVEIHRALVPADIQVELNAIRFQDDDVLDTTARIVTDSGDPVPEQDITATITGEDGTEIVSVDRTTDGDGEAGLADVTDIDGDYSGDTYYTLAWAGGGFTSFHDFYVRPLQQTGFESVIKVYSARGNPVRNALIYVDGIFLGTTGRDGTLSVRYANFPTKSSGSYQYVAVKGRNGARQTVPNDATGYVQFGALDASKEEKPTALDTTESRYGSVP